MSPKGAPTPNALLLFMDAIEISSEKLNEDTNIRLINQEYNFIFSPSNVPDQCPGAVDLRLQTGAPSSGSQHLVCWAVFSFGIETPLLVSADIGCKSLQRSGVSLHAILP